MTRIAAVVLAAGSSSRLGRPKQLERYAGLPLVSRAAMAALEAGTDPVVAVLGSGAEAVGAALSGIPVIPVLNPEWNLGLGTSIAAGVRAVLDHAPSAGAVLILLADQPRVGRVELGRLLNAWTSADARAGDVGLATTIAAAGYADTTGVPAVFGGAHFDALCSLTPGEGAARLLRDAKARVCRVVLPEAALEIDTPTDLERLYQ